MRIIDATIKYLTACQDFVMRGPVRAHAAYDRAGLPTARLSTGKKMGVLSYGVNKRFVVALGLALFAGFSGSGMAAAQLDPALKDYSKVSGIAGDLTSVGSDTLANLMTHWAEEFKELYPGVDIQIQASGSSTAPPALIENTANFGPMSRRMKGEEIEAFVKRYGYKPTPIRVAIDALAVYVHKDNPIEGMTLPQVDAVYSVTRKCGYPKAIPTWGDLGLSGAWENRRIQLFGRNSASGTYGYFKETALCKGDFKKTVNEQPGSASVVQAVSQSLDSIGYSGIGYRTSGVRAVPLAVEAGAPYVAPTPENTLSGQYPLARFLYIYVNNPPNKPLPPLEREFIKMVLSKRGQAAVVKDGYIPLPARVADKELSKIGVGAAAPAD